VTSLPDSFIVSVDVKREVSGLLCVVELDKHVLVVEVQSLADVLVKGVAHVLGSALVVGEEAELIVCLLSLGVQSPSERFRDTGSEGRSKVLSVQINRTSNEEKSSDESTFCEHLWSELCP